jgi:ABC-type multidrug transport system fused ATPase/permease subunit
LTSKFLAQNITKNQTQSIQQTIFALTTGVQTITIGILGSGITFISDGILLLVLSLGQFFVDPVTALITIMVFGFVSLVVYKTTSVRAVKYGTINSKLNIESNEKLFEVLSSFRESVVRNRREFYAREIGKIRNAIGTTNAEIAFMPNISKYVTESTVIVGAVLICGIQFLLEDSTHAISTLALFMAAGTRLAPAILRIQQSLIAMKSSSGNALVSIELIDRLDLSNTEGQVLETPFTTVHAGFKSSIKIEGLSAKYPKSEKLVLNGINLEILPGEVVGIVGSSGSGKSTLVDVILGVLVPQTGEVKISGKTPAEALATWPGAIGYVPQDVYIKDGSIAENISLGFETESVSNSEFMHVIAQAQLMKLVEQIPNHLDALVGEGGSMLSGGQKQRLGIARALLTRPELLILDEATSALDGKTESEITDAIASLKGKCTILIVAHQLSTISTVDKVIYLDEGLIKCIGTFEEVRRQVPDFDMQARLMGL